MNLFYDNFEKVNCITQIKDTRDNYYSFEQTVFYGEKGGQLDDKGTINDLPVTDLKWVGTTLYHQVMGNLTNPIIMKVDPITRYINTTVQSVFHLLDGYYAHQNCRIIEVNADPNNEWYEINKDSITEEQLDDVETWMNDIIKQDINTKFTYVPSQDYPDPLYRKYDQVRLVSFGSINTQPCGTLHVNHTSQIQSFVILGSKIKAHKTKIFFATNLVVNKILKHDHKIIKDVSHVLNTNENDLVNKSQNIIAKNKELKKQTKLWKEKYMQYRAYEISLSKNVLVSIKIDSPTEISQVAPYILKYIKHSKIIVANLKMKTYFAVISKSEQAQDILNYLKTKIKINGGGSAKIVTGDTSISMRDFNTLCNTYLSNLLKDNNKI
ncbi:MAG: hypothetical protein M3Z69_02060 [Bombilactobacillus mellis]|nr:hypothetical protein [Bombilactobacillus mellis]